MTDEKRDMDCGSVAQILGETTTQPAAWTLGGLASQLEQLAGELQDGEWSETDSEACQVAADVLRVFAANTEQESVAAGRRFPVLYDVHRPDDAPTSVPWSLLNERRARLNHGQDLETLASRGGLAPREMFCNVFDLHWSHAPPDVSAIAWLRTVANMEEKSADPGDEG